MAEGGRIRAERAVAAFAQAAADGQTVIVGFRIASGEEFSFAMPPEGARGLHNELVEALTAAKRLAKRAGK